METIADVFSAAACGDFAEQAPRLNGVVLGPEVAVIGLGFVVVVGDEGFPVLIIEFQRCVVVDVIGLETRFLERPIVVDGG